MHAQFKQFTSMAIVSFRGNLKETIIIAQNDVKKQQHTILSPLPPSLSHT